MGFRISSIRVRPVALIYLALGALLLIATFTMQPGFYHGYLHGQADFEMPDTWVWVSFQAESKPTWYWIRCPRNYAYHHVSITCRDYADDDNVERTVELNLTDLTWNCEGSTGPLDLDNLVRLITFGHYTDASDPAIADELNYIFNALDQMRTGTFSPPRHHSYRIEDPIRLSYTHFGLGGNYLFLGFLLCVAAWPVILFILRPKVGPGRLSPVKCFLITLGIVVALDSLFIAIGMTFSPGNVAETMEFLIGLLNFPAMLLTGGYIDPLALAFNALLWTDTVSLVVVLARAY